MFSTLAAVLDLHRALKKTQPPAPDPEIIPNKPPYPTDYTPYHFTCWLCSGTTNFGTKPSWSERWYKLDCKWCGMENRVKVEQKLERPF